MSKSVRFWSFLVNFGQFLRFLFYSRFGSSMIHACKQSIIVKAGVLILSRLTLREDEQRNLVVVRQVQVLLVYPRLRIGAPNIHIQRQRKFVFFISCSRVSYQRTSNHGPALPVDHRDFAVAVHVDRCSYCAWSCRFTSLS